MTVGDVIRGIGLLFSIHPEEFLVEVMVAVIVVVAVVTDNDRYWLEKPLILLPITDRVLYHHLLLSLKNTVHLVLFILVGLLG